MVAVFSGLDLGVAGSFAKVLGKSGLVGSAASGQFAHGVMVNAATGNLVVQAQDALITGRNGEFGSFRTYNSQGGWDGDNNDQWRVNNARRAVLTGTRNAAGSKVVVTNADGSQFTHTWDAATSRYLSREGAGAYDIVVWDATGTQWVHTDGATQQVSRFDGSSGLLVSETNTDGDTRFFTFDGAGRLSGVSESNGSSIQYTYGAIGTAAARNILQMNFTASATGGWGSKTFEYA
jgi:YD repeat-containing protein